MTSTISRFFKRKGMVFKNLTKNKKNLKLFGVNLKDIQSIYLSNDHAENSCYFINETNKLSNPYFNYLYNKGIKIIAK